MRKAVLILFISVIISSVVFLIYLLAPLFKTTPSGKKAPFDEYLTYHQWDLMFNLMQKMGYMVSIQKYDYVLEAAGCIVIRDSWNEDNFKKFEKWFKKNKRLVVFMETGKSRLSDSAYKNIAAGPDDPLLKDIRSLRIKRDGGFNTQDIYHPDVPVKYSTILKNGSDVLIRKASYKGAEIIFIGDQSLFSDKNILKEDNAVLLNNLFRDYYRTLIIFDETQTEKEKIGGLQKQESFITKGSFPYIMLQLLVLGIVFFLVNYKRFGNIIDANQYQKRSIRNHIEAVGNFLLNSGNNRALAGIFDEYFFEKLARLFPGRNQEELTGELRERYKNSLGTDIFQRNQEYNMALVESERYRFIKIIEKGEDYGKNDEEKKS